MRKTFNEPYELFAKDKGELSMISLKSKLIIIIVESIRDHGWSKRVAAEKLGVSQPRVSNLTNGHISKFAIDPLIDFLLRIGLVVDVSFRPNDKEKPICLSVRKSGT